MTTVTTTVGSRKLSLFSLFIPELGNTCLQMVYILDLKLIAHTQLPVVYFGVSLLYTFINLCIKIADSLGVATVIICASARVKDRTLLAMCALVGILAGTILAIGVCLAAPAIVSWYGLPLVWITHAIQYIRIRAIGLGLALVNMTLAGYLRAQGRSSVVMWCSLVGVLLYLVLDYTGLPLACDGAVHGLNPCAWAAVVQQMVIMTGFVGALYRSGDIGQVTVPRPDALKYMVGRFISTSGPIVVDKATLVCAKIWLARLVCGLGPQAQGAFCVVKELEQIAFIPAVAIASVCTILVSRQWAAGDKDHARSTIYRAIALAWSIVGILVMLLWWHAQWFVGLFDIQRACSAYAIYAIGGLSILVMADVLQLILAAALRAMGYVTTVMYVRGIGLICLVLPISYSVVYLLPPSKEAFLCLMGTFYVAALAMSIAYMIRLARMMKSS